MCGIVGEWNKSSPVKSRVFDAIVDYGSSRTGWSRNKGARWRQTFVRSSTAVYYRSFRGGKPTDVQVRTGLFGSHSIVKLTTTVNLETKVNTSRERAVNHRESQ